MRLKTVTLWNATFANWHHCAGTSHRDFADSQKQHDSVAAQDTTPEAYGIQLRLEVADMQQLIDDLHFS